MLSKQFIKSRDAMKVTFTVDFAQDAGVVEVAGEFTDWQPEQMKKLKNGTYKYVRDLKPGQTYQYRYRVDGAWENDWSADAYAPNGFGDDNSIVSC